MEVTISQAHSLIVKAIKARLVPMMWGSPAIGKSSIVRQIAEEFNLKLIDLRLSQCDPTDLLGFPKVEGNKASYVPMETFPIQGDELPVKHNADGSTMYRDVKNEHGQMVKEVVRYDGWLLFLDEFTSAERAVQAASYKLTLDHMVGTHHLHEKVAIVCAGNMESDNAISHPMSTALQSRLFHLQLRMDTNEWIDWAVSKKFDQRVISYIQFKPLDLYTFRADHSDKTYSSPRTWDFVNRALKVCDTQDKDAVPLFSGLISEGVAREFLIFCQICDDLPTIQSIIADPMGIKINPEPSVMYAISGAVAHAAKADNLDALYKFIMRMPVEFTVITMKMMLKIDMTLLQHPRMVEWVAGAGANLFKKN